MLLNGGRSSIGTKSRKDRFTGDKFGIVSDIIHYQQPFCSCSDALRIGDQVTLPTFKNRDIVRSGEVRYISYNSGPLNFYCSNHSGVGGAPNVWLRIQN